MALSGMRKQPEMGNFMTNIASALLMVGVAFMIWRAGTIAFLPVYWISKIAIPLAACALATGALFSFLPHGREFAAALRPYRFITALLITPFIGLAASTLAGFGWGLYLPLIRLEYIRLIFMIALFFITAYVAYVRPNAVRLIFVLIAASCVPLWLSLIPSWKLLVLEVGRLTGTGNDSNFLAVWIAVALIATIIFFLEERRTIRWAWLAGIFILTPLLLWTISRAAWLAIALTVTGILFIFLKERFSSERVRHSGIVLLTIITSCASGFFIFPPASRAVITIRMVGPLVDAEKLSHIIQWDAPGKNIGDEEFLSINNRLGLTGVLLDMIENNRGWLWKEGLKKIARAPLGFGPAYYFWNPIGIEGIWTKHKLNAHNLWLDVGLSMGWLGLALWILFIFRIGRDAFALCTNRIRSPESSILAASFFMLIFLGSFMDMFTQPILWIVMGLIVASSMPQHKKVLTTP
ncbi:MAG: O-antigen ligase family protein [bacterium]|nr:O-antigen ligase family protein [bacterium]